MPVQIKVLNALFKNLKPFGKTFYTFCFYKQFVFDPHPQNCLNFSKKSPQKIALQLFSRWSINIYCFKYSNILNFAIVYYSDT